MWVQLAPEGILHVVEQVGVTQRFSGSAPGVAMTSDYVFHILGVRVRT
jgi:hypothetical protein